MDARNKKNLEEVDAQFAQNMHELYYKKIDLELEDFEATRHRRQRRGKSLADEFAASVGASGSGDDTSLIAQIKRNYHVYRNKFVELGLVTPYNRPLADDELTGAGNAIEDRMARSGQLHEAEETPNTLSRGIGANIKELQQNNSLYVKGKPTFMDAYYLNMTRENTRVPEAFTELDHRQSVDEWFDTKLILHLRKLLQAKRNVEPHVSNYELAAVDDVVRSLFSKEKLRAAMTQKLVAEKFSMSFYKNSIVASKDDVQANISEARKVDTSATNPDVSIKNEEAVKQAISVLYAIKSQKHPHSDEHDRAYDYVKELMDDAKRPKEQQWQKDAGQQPARIELSETSLDLLSQESQMTALCDIIDVNYDLLVKKTLENVRDHATSKAKSDTLKEELENVSKLLNN